MLFIEILRILVDTAASILTSALLLRAWMQALRIGIRNPLGAFVFALTDWMVRPLRRVIPATARVDWTSLVAAFVIAWLALVVMALAVGGMAVAASNAPVLAVAAVFSLLKSALYLVMLLAIVWAVLSWVNPHAPIAPALDALLSPLLLPFRRILPVVGGLDLSPIGLFVVIQIALLILNEIARAF